MCPPHTLTRVDLYKYARAKGNIIRSCRTCKGYFIFTVVKTRRKNTQVWLVTIKTKNTQINNK